MDYTGKIPEVTDTLPFGDDTDKTQWDADFDGEDISYDEWFDEAMRRDLKYDTLKTITFADGTVNIPSINNDKSLTEVVIPGSALSVGSFIGCSKLRELNIPEVVEPIQDEAFKGCKALKKVSLPERQVSDLSLFRIIYRQ